jgi:hypothetical protein
MNILYTIITKIENNYTSYRTTNIEISKKFDIEEIIMIVRDRINKSNSISELDYIEDVLKNEYQKYNKLNPNLSCNFDIKEITTLITDRKKLLNK